MNQIDFSTVVLLCVCTAAGYLLEAVSEIQRYIRVTD